MAATLLRSARAVTPTAEIPDAGILFRDGVIEAIGPREALSLPAQAQEVTANGQMDVPGFLDVHIHGAGGRDVMEGTEDGVAVVARTVAARGTTSLVATTLTASPDD